ncbi:hypothetical protein BDV06DRAFT_200222 [Aspergillus oleicola]
MDFTGPTKPNTRICPILFARQHQNQQSTPSILTSPPEQATRLITLSQQKLSAESNNANPSLRHCLAHHRLLTKSIYEAKADMRVYLDEIVEYESDSEDEEDEDAVFDEHVESVGFLHDLLHDVRVVDGDNEIESMLFHEEPMVRQEDDFLPHPATQTHLSPPPGIPVPSSMTLPMPMPKPTPMPVPKYMPTSTATTTTHRPRSKIPRPSFSSKMASAESFISEEDKASNGHTPDPGASAGGVSPSATVNSTSPSTSNPPLLSNTPVTTEGENKSTAVTNQVPARLAPAPLPTFTSINRTTSTPNPSATSKSSSTSKPAHPIKDKIVNTVKGLVKRRNSSPSSLPMPSPEFILSSPTNSGPV